MVASSSTGMGCPHEEQKFAPSSFSWPQRRQRMRAGYPVIPAIWG
jgi:hypothetical protein